MTTPEMLPLETPVTESPIDFLAGHFLKRKEKNPSYSMRAFARDIGISPPQLSRIMSRQRELTYRQMSLISDALGLSERESNFWVTQVILKAQKNAKIPVALRKRAQISGLKGKKPLLKISPLSVEKFKVISQWYHFAILELTFLKDFDSNPEWIAASLGITVLEASAAIDRMIEIGLLEVTPEGQLKKTHSTFMVNTERSEPEIRKYETTMIERAKAEVQKTQQQEWENRVINSITFPSNPESIPELKAALAEFQKKIFTMIKGHEFEQVYHFGFQLYPVSKIARSKK